MGLKNKLKLLTEISVPKFIYYNFICKMVERKGKGYLIPYRHSIINIDKSAKIIIHDKHFFINYALPDGSKTEAYLIMQKNSVLEILGSVKLCYKSTIELHENSKVLIGDAYINIGSVILASESISIGNDVLIAREVFIYDSDHHPILDDNDKPINPAKPVVIEDHVWIGLKSVILRGSHIGTGAMISAGSVVGGKIKPNTMASGNPARSYSEIRWKD